MFIGHFALGYAAKRAVPRVSLAALFGAAQLADLLWPILVATGIEQVRIDRHPSLCRRLRVGAHAAQRSAIHFEVLCARPHHGAGRQPFGIGAVAGLLIDAGL